jgi:hypothetical protein
MNRHKKAVANMDISYVIEQFNKSESSPAHRKGTFKIEAPFEKAVDTILKVKPEAKKPKPLSGRG